MSRFQKHIETPKLLFPRPGSMTLSFSIQPPVIKSLRDFIWGLGIQFMAFHCLGSKPISAKFRMETTSKAGVCQGFSRVTGCSIILNNSNKNYQLRAKNLTHLEHLKQMSPNLQIRMLQEKNLQVFEIISNYASAVFWHVCCI